MLTRKKFVFFYVTLSFLALLLILHNSDRVSLNIFIKRCNYIVLIIFFLIQIIYCVNPKFEVLQTTPKPSFEVLEASTPTLLIDRACECVSSRTRESFDFCYKNPKVFAFSVIFWDWYRLSECFVGWEAVQLHLVKHFGGFE